MTLDEAIKHAQEIGNSCGNPKCSYEHVQLAKWLTELKAQREAWNKVLNDINDHAIEFEAFGITDNFISVGIMRDIIFKHLIEVQQEE